MSFLRSSLAWVGAGALTWWFLFFAPAPGLQSSPEPVAEPQLRTRLQPITEAAVAVESIQEAEVAEVAEPEPASEPPSVAEVEPAAQAAEAPEPEPADEPVVAAAELGARDGAEDLEERAAPEAPAEPLADPSPTAAELSADRTLRDQATRELSGAQASLGFSTTLISSPEDQLDIARAFGEDIVLIPRAALGDGDDATSFRLRGLGGKSPQIESLQGRPDLEHSRQYRDLFAYEFQRLPAKIRELRRQVIRRDEVFLFAALIPASEWAVVIGRRQEACLAASVSEDDVEQYVLRYVRGADGGFDFVVDEILLASGKRIRSPVSSSRRSGL